jgi:hypothetical protein
VVVTLVSLFLALVDLIMSSALSSIFWLGLIKCL